MPKVPESLRSVPLNKKKEYINPAMTHIRQFKHRDHRGAGLCARLISIGTLADPFYLRGNPKPLVAMILR
jgi:hypothetical protein